MAGRSLFSTCISTCQKHLIDRRTWGEPRGQPAHAHVQRDIAAAGAIVVLHLHAWYALQHVAHVIGARLDNGLPVDNGPGAGMLQHLFFVGGLEPIAHHGHGVERGFIGTGDGRCGLGAGGERKGEQGDAGGAKGQAKSWQHGEHPR